MENIQYKNASRDEVLEAIYDLSSESENGRVFINTLLTKIPEYHIVELNPILKYLKEKSLIKDFSSDNGGIIYITITSDGIDYVETNLKRKNKQNYRVEENVLDSNIRLLISHSSKDAYIAEAIIDLLRIALNISGEQIRCTSVDGYRLPIGSATTEQLRQEIFDTDVFIGLISYDSFNSAYVMFELGARWGSKKYFAPLLCPGVEMSILEGPLSGYIS